jgi:hypothetical protein
MPKNSSEYQKKYYNEHKEKMLQQIKLNSAKIIKCPICDKDVKQASMFAHKTTKLHRYIENKLITQPIQLV